MPVFIKFDGIDGEVLDSQYPGSINVMSFSWGVSNAGNNAIGGGGGAGKTSFSDLTITAALSKASPKLFLSCCTGQHIKNVKLVARKSGDRPRDYLRVTLEDVLISSLEQSGDSDGVPIETITLTFARIDFQYIYQKANGQLETYRAGWDLKTNKGF